MRLEITAKVIANRSRRLPFRDCKNRHLQVSNALRPYACHRLRMTSKQETPYTIARVLLILPGRSTSDDT